MDLAHIDLNLLVALNALLRDRNVTHAGQRMGLSQPAMSGTLARLRKLFRDDLLVQVGHHLEMTQLAQELAQPVNDLLEQVERMIDGRRAFSAVSDQRLFTIAASDYSTFLLAQPLLARLALEAPGISVQFVQLDSDVGEGLESGEIDFAILPAEAELRLNYPGRLLFEDRWVCVVSGDHPEVGHRMTREQFLLLPYLTFAIAKRGVRSDADIALADAGVRQRVVAKIESFVLLPFVLQGTRLVALIQRRLAERVKKAANIRILSPPIRIPDLHAGLYWNPRNTANPPHFWLRSILIEIGREISAPR